MDPTLGSGKLASGARLECVEPNDVIISQMSEAVSFYLMPPLPLLNTAASSAPEADDLHVMHASQSLGPSPAWGFSPRGSPLRKPQGMSPQAKRRLHTEGGQGSSTLTSGAEGTCTLCAAFIGTGCFNPGGHSLALY